VIEHSAMHAYSDWYYYMVMTVWIRPDPDIAGS